MPSAFAALSLPFQFLPLVIAVGGKVRERREVKRVCAQIAEAAEWTAAGALELESGA